MEQQTGSKSGKQYLKALCCNPAYLTYIQFSSVQSFSCVQLFATPQTAAHQASLSITNFQSLLKLMSIESVKPSNHLILSSPSPPAFNLSQHQGLFKWVSSLHQVDKILEFQLHIYRVHHVKCQAGWSTSWNQDFWEKNQSPQIHRWHHPYGKKRRRTKESLDESQRREWKSWLKTQHSQN